MHRGRVVPAARLGTSRPRGETALRQRQGQLTTALPPLAPALPSRLNVSLVALTVSWPAGSHRLLTLHRSQPKPNRAAKWIAIASVRIIGVLQLGLPILLAHASCRSRPLASQLRCTSWTKRVRLFPWTSSRPCAWLSPRLRLESPASRESSVLRTQTSNQDRTRSRSQVSRR